jgi:hypothetical protein
VQHDAKLKARADTLPSSHGTVSRDSFRAFDHPASTTAPARAAKLFLLSAHSGHEHGSQSRESAALFALGRLLTEF